MSEATRLSVYGQVPQYSMIPYYKILEHYLCIYLSIYLSN